MSGKLAHKQHPEQKKKGRLQPTDEQDVWHGVSFHGPTKDALDLEKNPQAQVAYRQTFLVTDSAARDRRHLPLPKPGGTMNSFRNHPGRLYGY